MEKHKGILTEQEHNTICTAIKSYCTLKENDPLRKCIDEAINFFITSPIHLKLFNEVLISLHPNRLLFCMDNFISEPQFYIYKREIFWRIAIVFYAMGIFNQKNLN